MKKSFKGTYRLRSLFGKWYINFQTEEGMKAIRGPYQYAEAQARCTGMKRNGWVDGDAS